MYNAQSAGMSRRVFLGAGLAGAALAANAPPDNPDSPSSLSTVDFRRLVSRADLVYEKPVLRSEEGIPIGNGRMGTLVWTTPQQLRFQINRVDVYGNSCATNSFFERHNDYCGGCAFLDIDLGAEGPPFPESGFRQHLSVYDGLLTIDANNLTVRIFAWPERDVIAISVEDRRSVHTPPKLALRMLRYESKYFGKDLEEFARDHIVMVERFDQTAASRLIVDGERVALTQDFREGGFCSKSAVAAVIVGRRASGRYANETDVVLEATEGGGAYTVLISSCAAFDPTADVLAAAFSQIDAAKTKTVAVVAKDTQNWWHSFWSRAFVHLTSPDGEADLVECNYNYFLYLMASSSRGKLPPKFNGMLWNTGGDLRTWGGQHWFANLSCYYEALPATNRFELMEPMYSMYSGMSDACTVAARQQWGSQGMFIPETAYFDGLERLPDDIAAEMQDLYLLRKPWEQRSSRFMEFAQAKHPHSSRWNWIQSGSWKQGRWVITERGTGPYGAVTHNFGTTAKVAYLYWRRYEYTLDADWLRDRAYPMLNAAAEFYRNHPNVKLGGDGRVHIHWANSNESIYGARDTDEDLSAMRGVFAAAARASEILGVDSSLRQRWQEFLRNLAPLPASDDPQALKPDGYRGPRVFVRGLKPVVRAGRGLLPDPNSLPMWFFDLCHLETRDQEVLKLAHTTFDQYFPDGLAANTPVSVLSKLPIAAASLGRADAVRVLVPNQIRAIAPERATAYKKGGVLANRMTLREGPQALDAERLGRAAEATNLALLQSFPPSPGEDPILRVFPAWPKEWDARFTLLARGAFLVSSSMRNGRVEFVEIESQAGAECRLRNPFKAAVTVYRDGRLAGTSNGDLLRLQTRQGERLILVAEGTTPESFRKALPAE
jgi:Glycosyl hydrolase family 95 catalytic domain/Domain of unknown function (DUF5703)/Glycoside hydrolase family 95, C-terminal domain